MQFDSSWTWYGDKTDVFSKYYGATVQMDPIVIGAYVNSLAATGFKLKSN
jgi:hypothetical protein